MAVMPNVPQGRPPLAASERRSAGHRVRFRPDELELVQAAAEHQGSSVAEFMRRAALERARAVLGQAGRGEP